MFDLFVEGGSLFMGMLTLVFLLVIVQSVRIVMKYNEGPIEEIRRKVSYIRSLGILAFVLGLFGQLIGLFQAFEAIQEMGDVPPALLAGGLRVSMITTLYGTLILIISMIIWLVLDSRLKSEE